ncbi:MAG TPA: hypothetical protein G4O10_02015 [Dehalococcoidia bacterium]|nr:hypothetical protein [Dehalococcoidia bacterium]
MPYLLEIEEWGNQEMKRKLLWLFLSCLVVLTLVAWSCGGTTSVNGEEEEEEEELKPSEVGECTFEIDVVGQGNTNPSLGSHTYVGGHELTITAEPEQGYHFVGWGGDIQSTSDIVLIIVDRDISVTAYFELEEPDLVTLVINIIGPGTTEPEPDAYTYDKNASVTITAKPDTYAHFMGWSGNISGTSLEITITMDSDKAITANFERDQVTLDLAMTGEGGGIIPTVGVYTYDKGTLVTVEVDYVDEDTAYFDGWYNLQGAQVSDEYNYSFDIKNDTYLEARFVRLFYFSYSWQGPGSVESSQSAGIYGEGTEITATSYPDSGACFVGWFYNNGYLVSQQNPYQVIMSGDIQLEARFATAISLVINVDGPGSSNPTEGIHWYCQGSQESITVTPDPGAHLVSWTVDSYTIFSSDWSVHLDFGSHIFRVYNSAGILMAIFTSNEDVHVNIVFDS